MALWSEESRAVPARDAAQGPAAVLHGVAQADQGPRVPAPHARQRRGPDDATKNRVGVQPMGRVHRRDSQASRHSHASGGAHLAAPDRRRLLRLARRSSLQVRLGVQGAARSQVRDGCALQGTLRRVLPMERGGAVGPGE